MHKQTIFGLLAAALVATPATATKTARDYELAVCDTVEDAKRLVVVSRGKRYVAQNVYNDGCVWRVAEYRRGAEAHPFQFENLSFKIVAVQLVRAYDDRPVPHGTKYIILQVTEKLIS